MHGVRQMFNFIADVSCHIAVLTSSCNGCMFDLHVLIHSILQFGD